MAVFVPLVTQPTMCHKCQKYNCVYSTIGGGGGRQRQKVKHKGGARVFSSEEQLREEQTQRLREEEWMVSATY